MPPPNLAEAAKGIAKEVLKDANKPLPPAPSSKGDAGPSTPKQKALPARPGIGSRATSYQSAVSQASNTELDVDGTTGQNTPRPLLDGRSFSLTTNLPRNDTPTTEESDNVSPKTTMNGNPDPRPAALQLPDRSIKKMPSSKDVNKKGKEKDRDEKGRKGKDKERKREKDRGPSMVDGVDGGKDRERSNSVVRDPMFGECANDAIELRKDRIERDKEKK